MMMHCTVHHHVVEDPAEPWSAALLLYNFLFPPVPVPDALKAQIAADIESAKEALGSQEAKRLMEHPRLCQSVLT